MACGRSRSGCSTGHKVALCNSRAWLGTRAIMTLEGLLLLGYTRLTKAVALGLCAWFLFNDSVDFGPLRTHPGLPRGGAVITMMWATLALTLLITGAYLWLAQHGSYVDAQNLSPKGADR